MGSPTRIGIPGAIISGVAPEYPLHHGNDAEVFCHNVVQPHSLNVLWASLLQMATGRIFWNKFVRNSWEFILEFFLSVHVAGFGTPLFESCRSCQLIYLSGRSIGPCASGEGQHKAGRLFPVCSGPNDPSSVQPPRLGARPGAHGVTVSVVA